MSANFGRTSLGWKGTKKQYFERDGRTDTIRALPTPFFHPLKMAVPTAIAYKRGHFFEAEL